MTRAALSLFASAIAVSAAASSCAPDPKGALVIAIDTDQAAGVDFDRFQIQITPGSAKDGYEDTHQEVGRKGTLTFPATLTVVSNGDPTTPIHVRVITGRATGDETDVGTPRTLREVVTTVPDKRVALLQLTIDWLCVGAAKAEPDRYVESACPEGLTCVAGDCVDWTIDASTLPDYDEAAVFGGGSSKGDGRCFDTGACFAAGAMAAVDPADCSVAAPSGGAGANVALVLRPGEGGICHGGACLVPVAIGTREGARIEGGRIKLPPPACAKLSDPDPAKRAVIGVATTSSCATKTASLPTCGPWSPFTAADADAAPPSGYAPPGDAGAD